MFGIVSINVLSASYNYFIYDFIIIVGIFLGDEKMVEWLIKHGANVNELNPMNNETALYRAVRHGNF